MKREEWKRWRREEEGARGEVKRGEKTVRKHMEGGVEGEATGIRRQEKEEEKVN